MAKSPNTKTIQLKSSKSHIKLPKPDFALIDENKAQYSFRTSGSSKKNRHLISPKKSSSSKKSVSPDFITEDNEPVHFVKKKINFLTAIENSPIMERTVHEENSPAKTPTFVQFFSPKVSSDDNFLSLKLCEYQNIYANFFNEIKLLDSGDFGEVFLAEDIKTKELVAVKISKRDSSSMINKETGTF